MCHPWLRGGTSSTRAWRRLNGQLNCGGPGQIAVLKGTAMLARALLARSWPWHLVSLEPGSRRPPIQSRPTYSVLACTTAACKLGLDKGGRAGLGKPTNRDLRQDRAAVRATSLDNPIARAGPHRFLVGPTDGDGVGTTHGRGLCPDPCGVPPDIPIPMPLLRAWGGIRLLAAPATPQVW